MNTQRKHRIAREPAARGRRFFVPIGVPTPGGMFRHLTGVSGDVARMGRLFAGLGYAPVPLPRNPSSGEVRNSLTDWLARTTLDWRDAVVIYYSGHGAMANGEHYLCTAGFDAGQVGASGLRTAELVEILSRRKEHPGKIWLILDCCQAGGAMTEGLLRPAFGEEMGIFVLAASGSWGQARDSAFSAAFVEAVCGATPANEVPPLPGPGGARSLDQIVDLINARTSEPRVVQAGISASRFDLLERQRVGAPRPALGSRETAVAAILQRRAAI